MEFKDKNLLILGAGVDQIFMIKTAKSMGIKTIVFDKDINAPGFKEADKFAVISTRDLDRMIKYLDNYINNEGGQINGVSTMGSDIPHIVATLSNFLGTSSISKNSAKLATNKFDMKKRFTKYGVKTPSYDLVKNKEEAKNIFNKYNGPIILKPIDQAGSRGVSLASNLEEIDELFEKALNNSQIKSVLIEQYIEGPQISSESIIIDSKIYTPGFADRNYEELEKFLPQIIENGGWVPSIHKSEKTKIEKELKKAALSLGIENGVIKGDIVLGEDGPYIIEIAARLSGGDFAAGLVPFGIGVNYVTHAINQALGLKLDVNSLKPKYEKTVANRYFFAKSGKLKNIINKIGEKKPDWLVKLEFWCKPGDTLPEIKSHGQRTGVFIVTGSNRDIVNERIDYVYSKIEFIVE